MKIFKILALAAALATAGFAQADTKPAAAATVTTADAADAISRAEIADVIADEEAGNNLTKREKRILRWIKKHYGWPPSWH